MLTQNFPRLLLISEYGIFGLRGTSFVFDVSSSCHIYDIIRVMESVMAIKGMYIEVSMVKDKLYKTR